MTALQDPVPLTTHRRSREHDLDFENDYHKGHQKSSPPDRMSQRLSTRLYWIFFIYGFTFLLPWNVVLVELPFFMSRIKGTGFERSLASYVLTVSSIALLIFLWHATATSVRHSASTRAIQSLLWITLFNVELLVMAVVDIAPGWFALLVFLNAIGQSIAAAYLQTAFWAIGSLFGSDAIQALSVGGAAVGGVVGVIQVFGAYFSLLAHGTHKQGTAGGDTAADNSDAARSSAIGLFTLTTIFLIVNVFIQWGLTGTREYREFVLEAEDDVALEEMQTLMSESSAAEMSADTKQSQRPRTAWEMLFVNKIYNTAIGYIFVVTTILFPAVTGFIESVHPESTSIWTQPLLFSAVHFLLFNLGDLVSRWAPLYPSLFVTSPTWLSILTYARTAFIPLFLMCNVNPSSQKSPTINSDLIFQLLVFLLGWTNGYLSAALQITSASLELNPRLNNRRADIDTASTVMGFALAIGLAIGSAASFAAKSAICGGCNPFIE